MGVICRGLPSSMGGGGERTEFDVKHPFGAQLLIFHRGHLLMYFPQLGCFRKIAGA